MLVCIGVHEILEPGVRVYLHSRRNHTLQLALSKATKSAAEGLGMRLCLEVAFSCKFYHNQVCSVCWYDLRLCPLCPCHVLRSKRLLRAHFAT